MLWYDPNDPERTQPCDDAPTILMTPDDELPTILLVTDDEPRRPGVVATIAAWRSVYGWFDELCMMVVLLIQCVVILVPSAALGLGLVLLTGLNTIPVLGGLLTMLAMLAAMGAFNALLGKIVPDAWWWEPW